MADAWVLSIKYALSSTGARGNVTAYDTYGRLGRWSPLQVAAASQTKPGTPHMLGGLDVIHVLTVPPSALLSFPILAIHLIHSHISSNLIQGRQRHSSSTPTCLSCRPRLPDKVSSHLPPSGSQQIPVRHDSSNA
ncbi:hypothetical protein VTJ04DRAFT_10207 [Mycothermus thermophilus]|uniref:uncharacterized protein n=1 Tax=Humicola insolens TaxID=85995 RepID=UPI00374327B8